jgi:hypothetical protein
MAKIHMSALRLCAVSSLSIAALLFVAACGSGGGGSAPEVDRVPPVVLGTTPVPGATNVSLYVSITVQFSEPMDLMAFMPGDGFVLRDQRGVEVPAFVFVDGSAVMFIPGIPLEAGSTYSAAVTRKARDVAGNALSSEYSWSFGMEPGPDRSAPRVLSRAPEQGEYEVSPDVTPEITFDEPLDCTELETGKVRLAAAAADIAGVASCSDATIRFTPASPVAYGEWCAFVIELGAVRDVSGNRNEEVTITFRITAVAPDVTPPSVRSFSPVDGVTGLKAATRVVVDFSEPIDHASTEAAFALEREDGARVAGAFSWSGSFGFAFVPAGPLAPGGYTARLSTDARDLAGNQLVAGVGAAFRVSGPGVGSWKPIATAGAPEPRRWGGHTAVWSGTEMIVWGGGPWETGGRYDPVRDAWTPTTTTGAPSARGGHVAVWDGTRGRMIVWGGYNGGYLGDGARYDPVLNSWSPIAAAGAPVARSGAAAIWTGSRMIVWGGSGAHGGLVDGGVYDPSADSWSPIEQNWDVGSGATAVWTGTDMIVWGGNHSGTSARGARYKLDTLRWTPISTSALGRRLAHRAVWTGDRMLVWGGVGSNGTARNDGGSYDPGTDTWAALPVTGAPYPRAGGGVLAVWTGSRMVVWGEYGETGGRFDPVSGTWSDTAVQGAPSVDSGHTAVWTGTEMIVWGPSGERYMP